MEMELAISGILVALLLFIEVAWNYRNYSDYNRNYLEFGEENSSINVSSLERKHTAKPVDQQCGITYKRMADLIITPTEQVNVKADNTHFQEDFNLKCKISHSTPRRLANNLRTLRHKKTTALVTSTPMSRNLFLQLKQYEAPLNISGITELPSTPSYDEETLICKKEVEFDNTLQEKVQENHVATGPVKSFAALTKNVNLDETAVSYPVNIVAIAKRNVRVNEAVKSCLSKSVARTKDNGKGQLAAVTKTNVTIIKNEMELQKEMAAEANYKRLQELLKQPSNVFPMKRSDLRKGLRI